MSARGFSMKFDMIDVVVPGSLRNVAVAGRVAFYAFDMRLNYYRGHFLSVIDEFRVAVDGLEVPEERLRLRLGDRSFGFSELKNCRTEFWNIRAAATISVEQPGGLESGAHKIDVTMFFRSPYMAIGPDHQYMPVDGSGSATMSVPAREGA